MKTHAVARCRWCGGPFQRVYGKHWICLTSECADKQIAHAFAKDVAGADESPWHMLPLPFQVDVEEHPVKRLLVHGAVGVAKSYFARWYAYRRLRQVPGFRALLLRASYDQLNKNHLQFMDDEARIIGKRFKWTPQGSSPNARQMRCSHGANDPTSVLFAGYLADEGDIAQHIGPEWDLILLEEGVHLIVKGIREVMGRDRGAGTSASYREALGLAGQTRILTNPGGRAMNYLDDMFIKKAPPPDDYQNYDPRYFDHIAGKIADNPYLPEDFEQANLGHLDKDRHAQLAAGRWDVFEGQFFTDFNPNLHVQAIEAE